MRLLNRLTGALNYRLCFHPDFQVLEQPRLNIKKYTNLEFNNPYYLTIHQFFVKKYLSFTTDYFDCINKDPDQLVEEIHLIEAKRSFNSIIISI